MRLCAVALLCFSVAACLSVPLSTMARMSTFDERDFAALDPDAIRTKIKLTEGYALDAGKSSLAVKINSDAGEHYGEFKLEQLTAMRTQLSKGMFSGDEVGTEYTLRLAEASKAEFRKLQAFVLKGHPGDILIAIKPDLSTFPNDAAYATVWIDLLLTKDDGYFTLVDAAQIPMDKIRAAHEESKR